MKTFTGDPRKMSPYITDDIKELIKSNLQTRRIWVNKFECTRAEIHYWYTHHSNKHNIRNFKCRMSSNNTGVLGIDYQEVSKVENNSDTDWMTFIKEDSGGLTKDRSKTITASYRVRRLLRVGSTSTNQMAYRWSGSEVIANTGNFSQVGERHDNPGQPCKVYLRYKNSHNGYKRGTEYGNNTGNNIYLIPSNMIILKEKGAGYNNVLTLATKGMKFGKNKDVDYVRPVESERSEQAQRSETTVEGTTPTTSATTPTTTTPTTTQSS